MAKAKRTTVRASKRAPARPKRARKSTPASAKPSTAPRQRARAAKPRYAKLHATRRYAYTPELMADGRRRYEETDATVADIAADFGCAKATFQRLANDEGWVRYAAPPRDLVPAAQLEAQAAALPPAREGEAPLDIGPAVARLFKLVEAEIAAAEAMRAQLARRPRRTLDAQRTASTLRSLYGALHSLERRQAGLPRTGSNDDDIPQDIDALREALAARIEAFMESRGDDADAFADDAPAGDRPVE